MGVGEGFQLGTVGALSLSVVSSVSIVICNRGLISTLGFTFATTLTSWHLLVTFCSLHVALWMKLFEHKPFDARAVMGFGILNGSSIGLLNLSLGFNSVGFYQMTKLAIIPCTVLLETIFFRKKFRRKRKQRLILFSALRMELQVLVVMLFQTPQCGVQTRMLMLEICPAFSFISISPELKLYRTYYSPLHPRRLQVQKNSLQNGREDVKFLQQYFIVSVWIILIRRYPVDPSYFLIRVILRRAVVLQHNMDHVGKPFSRQNGTSVKRVDPGRP